MAKLIIFNKNLKIEENLSKNREKMSEVSTRSNILDRMRSERDRKLREMMRDAGISLDKSKSPMQANRAPVPHQLERIDFEMVQNHGDMAGPDSGSLTNLKQQELHELEQSYGQENINPGQEIGSENFEGNESESGYTEESEFKYPQERFYDNAKLRFQHKKLFDEMVSKNYSNFSISKLGQKMLFLVEKSHF